MVTNLHLCFWPNAEFWCDYKLRLLLSLYIFLLCMQGVGGVIALACLCGVGHPVCIICHLYFLLYHHPHSLTQSDLLAIRTKLDSPEVVNHLVKRVKKTRARRVN